MDFLTGKTREQKKIANEMCDLSTEPPKFLTFDKFLAKGRDERLKMVTRRNVEEKDVLS
jgi:hypothetical protein